MREGVCTFQEGIYGSEVSLLEMASQNLSSVFAKFLLLWLVHIGRSLQGLASLFECTHQRTSRPEACGCRRAIARRESGITEVLSDLTRPGRRETGPCAVAPSEPPPAPGRGVARQSEEFATHRSQGRRFDLRASSDGANESGWPCRPYPPPPAAMGARI